MNNMIMKTKEDYINNTKEDQSTKREKWQEYKIENGGNWRSLILTSTQWKQLTSA